MNEALEIMNVRDGSKPNETIQAQVLNTLKKQEAKKPKEKRPEGINRELYSLIGGAPPLAPTHQGLKEKPKLGSTKAVEWKWASFTNPARGDNFTLNHWVKASEVDEEYPFAKFDKQLEVLRYNDEEYEKYFQDPNWTQKETDDLFDACERYELRFPVIQDRLDTERSIEDLKYRYYSIVKNLLEQRCDLTDQKVVNEIAKYNFDKEKEIERKQQLELLHKRTIDQVKEEEMLLIEARRIEQNSKKILRDRQHVIKLLNTLDTSLPLKKSTQKSSFGSPTFQKTAEISRRPTIDTPDLKKKKRLLSRTMTEDSTDGVEPESPLVTGTLSQKKKEKIAPGAYVRSTRLAAPLQTSAKMIKRVEQLFEELGIPLRPTMPTAQICQVFEDLRQDALKLLELKKLTDKEELELKTLETRKAQLKESLNQL